MTLSVFIHDDRLIHKVKSRQWLGATDFCCVRSVSHYLNDILCKNYNHIFLFVLVMPKIIVALFFSGHGVYICTRIDKHTDWQTDRQTDRQTLIAILRSQNDSVSECSAHAVQKSSRSRLCPTEFCIWWKYARNAILRSRIIYKPLLVAKHFVKCN